MGKLVALFLFGVFVLTSGTCSFSACDEAASVVTVCFARGTKALRLRGRARPLLRALVNMLQDGDASKEIVEAARGGLNVGRSALALLGTVDFSVAREQLRLGRRQQRIVSVRIRPRSFHVY